METAALNWAGIEHRNYVIGDYSGKNTIQTLAQAPKKPMFFHISKDTAQVLKRMGYYITPMGVTHRINNATYAPKSNSHRTLRHQINRAIRDEVEVKEAPIESVSKTELEALSYRWLRTKPTNNRFLGFLLRKEEFIPIPGTRWFFAYKNNKLVGFHCYFPFYKNDQLKGYTADTTRTCPSAPKGTNTLLTHTAIQTFKLEQIPITSLGLAPFAPLNETCAISNDRITHILFKGMYHLGNWILNFKGLAMHKNHYRAQKEPIYFASPRPFPLISLLKAYKKLMA